MKPIAPARLDIRKRIDAFLKARKTLGGTASWGRGNRDDERRAVWPVLLAGRSVGATLQATAYPHENTLRFTIGLECPDCIWRLDFEPYYKHHPNAHTEVVRLGVEPRIAGPHFHAWADNRHLVRGARVGQLPVARAFKRIKKWDAALRWFCGETNIVMQKAQMLEFPRRDRLL